MTRPHPALGILIAFVVIHTGCALGSFGRDPRPGLPGVTEACHPSFPDRDGWYGGDGAYSIPLSGDSPERVLWLFGDSFVHRPGTPSARSYPFIHNSIGISTCRGDEGWALETFWRDRDSNTPRAFFRPDRASPWFLRNERESGHAPYYWPFDGFVVDDTLYVGLLRVSHSEPRGPFHLPFRLLGMDLAEITNPHDVPDEWQVRILPFSEDHELIPGAAFVVLGDYVYAFAFFDRNEGRAPRAIARLPRTALRDTPFRLPAAFETWTKAGRWQPGLLADEAAIILPEDATEMSVHFDAGLEAWLAVETSPSPSTGTRSSDPLEDPGVVRIRRAPRLEGPWSKPVQLFEIPEVQPNADGRVDPNVFCYAAKAHPEFAAPRELVITYVCNLFARAPEESRAVLWRLADSPDLYRARAVRVPLPTSLAEAP